MAPIKTVALSFILLAGPALVPLSFASDDDLLIAEFRKSLARNIRSEMTEGFRSELSDSGLSPADVNRVVSDLEDSIETCFVDATIKYAQKHEIPLAELVTEDDGDYSVTFKGNEGVEFGDLLSACSIAARAEAGISM